MSTLIVNGPPGSGKSTVARLLATESPRGVHLPGDLFWRFICNHLPPGAPDAEEQNRTVLTALASASADYDRGGYEVFVDGMVRPSYLDVFLREYDGSPLDEVVLLPSLETCIERARARGDSDPAVLMTSDQLAHKDRMREQVQQRHALFADDPNALATDGLTTSQVAAAIRAHVQSGRARINLP